MIGHGGGGPGYAAACFALVRERSDPLVAIELSGDERVDVQAQALDELRGRRYPRLNSLRTGELVRPEVSRTAIVTVYRPLPRKRWAGTQLRV